MTNQDTINKLVAIKFSAMASAFELQLADSKVRDVPFEDRIAMLVDAEFKIIDRIFYDSYVVNILPVDKDNDKSMREVYGMV